MPDNPVNSIIQNYINYVKNYFVNIDNCRAIVEYFLLLFSIRQQKQVAVLSQVTSLPFLPPACRF